MWETRLSPAAVRFPEIFSPQLVDRLHGLPRTVERAIESLRRSAACWIHGDAHLDNVLFRLDGTAVLLDWSGAATGPPAVHLARLLTEGVNAGARRELATDLISAYADELDASGAEALIGIPGKRCRTASRRSSRPRSPGLLATRPESRGSECRHCRRTCCAARASGFRMST